jgi:hypothetical protein
MRGARSGCNRGTGAPGASAGKAIINGRGNDLVELVHTNLFR